MTDTNNLAASNQSFDSAQGRQPDAGIQQPAASNKHLVQDLLQHKKLLYIGATLSVLVFIGAMVLIRQGQNKINKTTQEATTNKTELANKIEAGQNQSKTTPAASAVVATEKIPPDKPRQFVTQTQPQTPKKSSLYLKSDATTYQTGTTVNFQAMIQGKGEKVDGAEFILNYDPKLVSIGALTNGTFFSLYPQKVVNVQEETVRVIALQKSEENKNCNEEVIVSFPVTLLQKGQVSFTFAKDKTHISGYGGKELLEETTPLTITVN